MIPAMPVLPSRDLAREWKASLQAVLSAATRSDIPHALLAPIERQVELVEQLVERAFAPVDAVFDLLEQSGAAMRRQAEALSESARALEQTADLMRAQAELFERTVQTVRQPAEMAKGVTRRGTRERHTSGSDTGPLRQ
jgi:methyl-accepting chemotaxis protein